jgi:maleylpyruvate isomerase
VPRVSGAGDRRSGDEGPAAVDERALDRDVAGAAGAHQRLLATLDAARAGSLRADGEIYPRAPSRLPGWSIGHVLTHLARNADSHHRLLDGLAQYEGGAGGRDADIEAGAGRDLADLVADVRRSIWALERRWASQADWAGIAHGTRADMPRADLPFLRWRETEVHHVDLGLGYEFADLPADYVRLELRRLEMMWAARRPMGMTMLPDAALAAPPHERLAWLLGRAEIAGLAPAGIF